MPTNKIIKKENALRKILEELLNGEVGKRWGHLTEEERISLSLSAIHSELNGLVEDKDEETGDLGYDSANELVGNDSFNQANKEWRTKLAEVLEVNK